LQNAFDLLKKEVPEPSAPERVPVFRATLLRAVANNVAVRAVTFGIYIFLVYPPEEFTPPLRPFETHLPR
jgi:hypothetical protein